MKRPTVRFCATLGTSVLCLAAVLRLPAQTTASNQGQIKDDGESPVVLSPFVVDGSEDHGYQATSTLAGTRVRTELKDVASAISVVTQQFLQDTGSKNSQDLLVYTPNTEVAGLQGNFSGQGGIPQYNEALVNPANTTRVRGLDSADNTRDYFLTDIPWDSFNVGRVDLQRGPNSILFGVGSPAGIINTSMNDASFKDANKVENRVSSFGSIRNSVDFNKVLLKDQLAIRVAFVNDEEKYRQKPAHNNSTRYYAALRYDPNLFGEGNHTSIRAKFEKGKVNSNNPRTLPPVDEITPWFETGTNAYGNPGYNKLTINQYLPGMDSGSALATSTYNLGSWAQGRTYYPDVLTYFNGAASDGTPPAVNSSAPTKVVVGMIPTVFGVNSTGAVDGTIGGLPNFRPVAIPDFSLYAAYAPVPIQGGGNYYDKVLTDPSIFDFYTNLLDGPNKREWQGWEAGNVAVSQTFFKDRLGFELVYDQQSYHNGQVSFLQGANYAINIDPNVTYADGALNPNVGRPYVANSFWAGSNSSEIDRNSLRLTATAELRAEDVLGKGLLASILGRHVFTGLWDEDQKRSKAATWSQYATAIDWAQLIGVPLNTLTSNRQFDWVDYLGSSLSGASSASGANLPRVTNLIQPSSQSAVNYFNSHWNAPGVNPGAPFTYVSYQNGATVASTQSENPANYVGWQTVPVTWLSANNPQQFQDLVTSAQKFRYTDISKGFTWQGFMLDGDFVPTFGWRKDSVVNYSTAAPSDPVSGVVSASFDQDPTSRRVAVGESKSWGGVYHLPRSLTSKLPGGTTLSLFYERSGNFKADAPRQNLFGDTIANPNGITKEYGFTLTTLNDKVSLKVDWYSTKVSNATFDVSNGNSIAGLGSNGYWMWAAPDWGLGFSAQLQDGLEGHNPNNNWNYAAADGVAGAAAGPGNPAFDNAPETALSKQIVAAWLKMPLPTSFFTYYGIHPLPIDTTKLSSGEIRDVWGPGYTENINIGAENWSGSSNAVSTVDTLSKGTEFELTAQPTKNWNISVNYSRTFATRENIDPATTLFMDEMHTFFTGPAGQLRIWGINQGDEIGPQWINAVYNPYLVEVHSAGQSAPEVAPWRFNGVTTYGFDEGTLKGAFIGGAVRMEAGRILGYQYSAALGTLDVTKPWIGSTDHHVDLWFGYSHKIYSNKINWRIQVNLRNVGEKVRLVPSALEPDGSLALARIQEGLTWQIANAFEF